MEDDEKTLSKVNRHLLVEVEGSTMEVIPLETEELTNTEQCDFVPESVPNFDDSQLVVAGSPNVAKEGEPVVAEEETPLAGIKMGTDTEVSAGGNSVPELHDSQIVGAEPPIAVKDDKNDADKNDATVLEEEEEIPMAETKVVTETNDEAEVEASRGGGGEHFPELHDSQLVGPESRIAAKDDGDHQAAVEEEIPMADSKMEMDTKTGAEIAELHDSQVDGTESLIVAKDEEEDEAVEEEIPTADAKMETATETEAARGAGGECIPVLDDLQLPGAVSPNVAEEDEEEALVAEEETPTVDTEMETETDVMESGKGVGGKRKRGRNPKVPARAPARKTTEEDVCFICFDGGDLVLCDRRGCPKAYHPSCVNRDEAFFRAKGRWNCGFGAQESQTCRS